MKTEERKAAMLVALENSIGIVTTAAKAANINPKTHYEWLKKDSEYKEAVEEIENTSLDFAESKLLQLMTGVKIPETKVHVHLNKDGNAVVTKTEVVKHFVPDNASVIFFLKTKGKGRGYVVQKEVVKSRKIIVTNTNGGN